MNNPLRSFWQAANQVFGLARRLRGLHDHRCEPAIPPAPLYGALLLGALLRVPSFLQLQHETQRRAYQRLLRWSQSISDDSLGYALERANLEELRGLLVAVNRTLKANKALESAKIHGLLVVAIDGNEQFASRARCCAQCARRQVKVATASGAVAEVTEYYHRQVYAQLHGPQLSVILDVEPLAPGEDETQAALRLLGRLRRLYGPRFFDVVSVDAWYCTTRFLQAVDKLGWAVVSVLKQERFEVYQESTRLRALQSPRRWQWQQRHVQLWDFPGLRFAALPAAVRVVAAEESWSVRQQAGGQRRTCPKQSSWRWLVTEKLADYDATVIWQIGHQRWGVENHAFNELTQHYHLTHCPHHEPVAIIGWLLILVLGFGLFEWFVRVHGKLWRRGQVTLQELARELNLALARWEELRPLWSG